MSARVKLHLDKVLFSLSCFYLGGVLVWLATQAQTQPSVGETLTPSPQDTQFIAYLEKSLELIDKRPKYKPPPPAPVVTAPPVVEKIYVPVYPPAPAPAPAPRQVSPAPLPEPVVVAPLPPPLPTKPTSVPVLTPGKALLPASPVNHTLVGVLELGDRPVALFDSQGMTKRVGVGEMVGSWQVVAINNQQVTLKHNGYGKSLSVGQSL